MGSKSQVGDYFLEEEKVWPERRLMHLDCFVLTSAKLLNQTWNWLGLKTHQSLSPLQIGFLKKEGSLEEWGVTLHPFSFFK